MLVVDFPGTTDFRNKVYPIIQNCSSLASLNVVVFSIHHIGKPEQV